MFVCQHCGETSASTTHKRAANAKAWAIGNQAANGFHIRRIVWGLLMAQAEKRIDEEIREVLLMVEAEHKKRAAERPLPDYRKPKHKPDSKPPDEEVPF